MTQPRSSLAVALLEYKGLRPGLALTIAAVTLVIALVAGVTHVALLRRSGVTIGDGQRTLQALHEYNSALEQWGALAATPDSVMEFEEQRRIGDSIGVALRVSLQDLRGDLTDPAAQQLVDDVLAGVRRPDPSDLDRVEELSAQGRRAMIALTMHQDSALFQATADNQRAQLFAAIVVALTLVAAVVLIGPMSWLYVRHKRGVPPGV